MIGDRSLKGKTIAVLVADAYEDMELWYPVFRLREENAKVWLVGPQGGQTYSSKHGYPARSDQAAMDAVVGEFDAVIIPGGYAPDRMRRDAAMVRFVGDALREGKIVAAICHGASLLCSAGDLAGRRMTSYPSIKDDLINAGADWMDQEVVCDDNLITSRTPKDLPAFMGAIIEELTLVPVSG